MLSCVSVRSAVQTVRVQAQNIFGEEWFCTDRNGKGIITTTGDGSAPTPPDYLLMGLGACAGNGIKFCLSRAGKPARSLSVQVEADWANQPQRRFSDIRMKVKCDADIPKDELQKIIDQTTATMCPVAGTLLTKANITATVAD
jgi:uncharacterized OsmC-like protein